MDNGKVDLHVSEIVALIKHSNTPTVLIEGLDDIVVYRKIEDIADISVLQTGGRIALLEIFQRRSEFADKKVAFIADKDYWSVIGVPNNYIDECLVFTDGYSLENDIFVDINVAGMLTKAEIISFKKDIERFLKWYSLALHRHMQDGSEVISHHPNSILANDERYRNFCQIRKDEKFPDNIFNIILSDPYKKIRGKSLMDLAIRYLGTPERKVVHKNPKVFLDIAAAKPGDLLTKIFSQVQNVLEKN